MVTTGKAIGMERTLLNAYSARSQNGVSSAGNMTSFSEVSAHAVDV